MSMRKHEHVGRMWTYVGAVGLIGGVVGTSCAVIESRTGETHFLRICEPGGCGNGYECLCGACTKVCDDDAACAGEKASAECVNIDPETCSDAPAVCDVTCSQRSDCKSLGSDYDCVHGACRATARGPAPPSSPSCPAGCSVASGFPWDASRGCVDLDAASDVGCACGSNRVEVYGPEASCTVRVADGSVWSVPRDVTLPEGEWVECTDEQARSLRWSCDMAQCDDPTPSLCSLEATCDELGCGGFQFDEAGCSREACSADTDCASDERCASGSLSAASCAPLADGSCECASLLIEMFGRFCHPVSTAGRRGAWQQVVITNTSEMCAPPGCASTWTLTPDGTITKTEDGSSIPSASVDDWDLTLMVDYIDGLELRPWLESGGDCTPVEDWDVILTLELDGATLTAPITGCLGQSEYPAAVALYEAITRY